MKSPLVSLAPLLDRPDWARLAVQECRGSADAADGRAALGFALTASNDPAGVDLVSGAAEDGVPDALFWLAVWSEEGLTVNGRAVLAPNVDRHRTLLRQAAESGQPEAQVLLGRYHQTGRYVPKNLEAARVLYRQAADAGYPDGLFMLGAFVSQGLGGPQDIERGAALVRRAAALGHAVARWTQAATTINDDSADPDAVARALADLHDLAQDGLSQAVLTLGMALMEGRMRADGGWIVRPDPADAKAVFCRAGERGEAHFRSLYQEPLRCDAAPNATEQAE